MEGTETKLPRLQFHLFVIALLFATVNSRVSEKPSERVHEETKDKIASSHSPDSKNQLAFELEYEKHRMGSSVLDATVECVKRCNYKAYDEGVGECFGSFQSNCRTSQLFADGHVLETKTTITCVGGYTNKTQYTRDMAITTTACSGQLEQFQVVDVYDSVYDASQAGENRMTYVKADTFYNSYSCRHFFVHKRRAELGFYGEPSLLSGSIETTCDASQGIQIQKGYCTCSKESCNKSHSDFKTFQFGTSADQHGSYNTSANHYVDQEATATDPVAANFIRLAESDPELAQRVADAIIRSASKDKATGDRFAGIPLVILQYGSTNTYDFNRHRTHSDWSSRPSTAWPHVFCNGRQTAFSSECNGVLSANVRFGKIGSANVGCKGDWKTYEDVTYVCDGTLTEDETDSNDFGTFFSKISHCSGTVAISPLSTKVEGDTKYYGLSEICNGDSFVSASYNLEALDHRYLTQIIDPRTMEQIICLVADRNCEQLRYFM